MKVVFMGTPDFAVPSLRALAENGYDVPLVITQPDKPRGRGKKLMPSPVKEEALRLGIEVFQPERLRSRENRDILAAAKPDICVTAAYGQILSQRVLDIPPLGVINVHGSLLPAYRGPNPMQWVLINGEKVTGITTMHTSRGIDEGDMILKCPVEILPEDDFGTLHDKLAEAGAKTLIETLALIEKGCAPREAQDASAASYYRMLDKKDFLLDFASSPERLVNVIRAGSPVPGAYAFRDGGAFKFLRAQVAEGSGFPGEVLSGEGRLVVACGSGAIEIINIQAPGGKAMPAADYLRGHRLEKGSAFTGAERTDTDGDKA